MRNDRESIIKILIKNMQQEISCLEEIYVQIEPLIKKVEVAKEEEKVFYNRAAGSILHDFYTGIEKIFCDIANKMDKIIPSGEDWHIKLLKSMAEPKRGRPQVISGDSMEELKEYLGFRHLFRNIYGAQLDWVKLEFLLSKIQENLWMKLKAEFNLFINKIEDKGKL